MGGVGAEWMEWGRVWLVGGWGRLVAGTVVVIVVVVVGGGGVCCGLRIDGGGVWWVGRGWVGWSVRGDRG